MCLHVMVAKTKQNKSEHYTNTGEVNVKFTQSCCQPECRAAECSQEQARLASDRQTTSMDQHQTGSRQTMKHKRLAGYSQQGAREYRL